MTEGVQRREPEDGVGDLVLTLSCPDRPGIVAAVTQRLFEHRANIEESQQFSDHRTGRYFMRVRFATPADGLDLSGWQDAIAFVANEFDLT